MLQTSKEKTENRMTDPCRLDGGLVFARVRKIDYNDTNQKPSLTRVLFPCQVMLTSNLDFNSHRSRNAAWFKGGVFC